MPRNYFLFFNEISWKQTIKQLQQNFKQHHRCRMEWLPIDKLDEYEAYPMFFREKLKNMNPIIEHIVTHQ